MTEQQRTDDTTSDARPTPATRSSSTGVQGGDADRLDAAPGSGGVPAAGADGSTQAREELRRDLGERGGQAGSEAGGPGGGLDQAAALGETDDPDSGSLAGG